MNEDWLSAYLRYVEESEPPELYKIWTGISALAACLQRKCFLEWDDNIYPNMFVVLIGPSGCRKGTAMKPALHLIQEVGIKLVAESITREALIREFSKSTDTIIDTETNIPIMHSSLTVFSQELAVFLGYDNSQFLSDLTDLYDCSNKWTYRTKTSGTDEIMGVWLNLIGATTPELLQSTLPTTAIGGGLTSRMIFVYGDKRSKLVPYPINSPKTKALRPGLISDLEAICAMRGRFVATEDFIDTYTAWYVDFAENSTMDDDKLRAYYERKPTHLRKLSMILSASRSSEMILRLDDFNRSLAILTKTENVMSKVFRGYGRSDVAELYPRIMGYISLRKEVVFGELLKKFYRDLSRQELDEILVTLQGIGFATLESVKQGAKSVVVIRHSGLSQTGL